MLSKSAARRFFLGGTFVCFGAFVLLTLDTLRRIPAQTNQEAMTDAVVRGKHLWDSSNCMGCHTLLGEGAYYAPELTRVYERRGPMFIAAMLKDPQAMYPGQRRMQDYGFDDAQINDLVAFLQWIGTMDLNGFPAKPTLGNVAVAVSASGDPLATTGDRPQVFNQICIACHSLRGQGGQVGPALDDVGNRFDVDYLQRWLRDPASVKKDTKMPKLPLSEESITELAAFLSKQTTAPKKEAGK
ncbi:MAG: c-type cytochrome [Planctomycetes bacterium]|nr:c-type cytochrome [Planctomycetota bacterium]MBZ0154280.1 c-type cytochrome [Planctomycetota bacterium]MCC7396416.1 c-type cytochrome [Planctomycetota bacterium]